jgi:muramoyltetrapeptide carboxypeptidase
VKSISTFPQVAIIAPSSPYPIEDFQRGVAWLRERTTVDEDPRWYERNGYFVGTDATRAGAIVDALRNQNVRALIAARGGYGASRILETAADTIRDALLCDPKPVVGYSDVTALHALWAHAGVRSLHASMVSAWGRNEGHPDEVLKLLMGNVSPKWEGLTTVVHGASVTGPCFGGNLSVIASLAATPFQYNLRGAVLLLEDVGEVPYRIDRMLTNLRMSGVLKDVAAIVLGEFVRCRPNADGVTAEEVCRERLESLGVPVVSGAPFGHGEVNLPWVVGARATVDSANATVTWHDGI